MGWLFPSTVRDEPLTSSTVQLFIKNHARKLGLPEGVTPHTMRHCFACHALEDGVSHTFIQQLLGHEDISTTSGFYAFATLDTLSTSMAKADASAKDEKLWKDPKALKRLYRL